MAMVVHCSCGYPLDVDQLELVVSLTCPSCSNELDLEVELDGGQSGLATLSIVEGPHWVGEHFVMPVGRPLIIGSAEKNWLCLHSDALNDMHCRVRVAQNGALLLEDLQSSSGTWVGKQRISRCRLGPQRAFSAGGYRFLYALQSSDASTVMTAAPHDTVKRKKPKQAALGRIKSSNSALSRIIAQRFSIARIAATVFAVLVGIHHLFALSPRCENVLSWPAAGILAAVFAAALIAGVRRIVLGNDIMRFIAPALLTAIWITDLAWGLYGGAVAALCFCFFLTIVLLRVSSETILLIAGIIGGIGTLLLALCAIRSIVCVLG